MDNMPSKARALAQRSSANAQSKVVRSYFLYNGAKTKAYKQLLQLRRCYAGSEFGDKATEKMKLLKTS